MLLFGKGILITGKPRSGKTHLCMALLRRGHAIIADDAVVLETQGNQLIGSAPTPTAGKIAIQPNQIASVVDHFGPSALATRHPIHYHLALDDSYQQSQLHIFLAKLPLLTYENLEQFEFVIQNELECDFAPTPPCKQEKIPC